MTTQARIVRFAPVAAGAFIAAAGLLFAGPLTPPAGPVTSTYKTLSEVEPRIAINAANTPGDADSLFKITVPGSYYLTGNITGVAGKHGIEVAALGVTLDLNGFDLAGVAGSLDGVSTTALNLTNIAVLNGSVRSWGDEGIDLATFGATNCRVEGVLAAFNAGGGISTNLDCTISNCSAYLNTGTGINTNFGGTVAHCSAAQNTGTGISAGIGATVSHCSAYLNTINGITVLTGCTVSDCSAYDNSGTGITTSSGCTIAGCTAYSNTGNGINVVTGCTIVDCTVRLNTLDGIACLSSCVIRGNSCSFNGLNAGDGAGIHTTGGDNRIEGNNCSTADRGIDVDNTGNIIIGNTCSGNASNWEIAFGNSIGPIVVAGFTAAVISGNGPAASTLGSTDPHANFTY